MKPVFYQILPRYWGAYNSRNVRGGSLEENRCGHFGDFDVPTLEYIKSLGVSHIWYTGVLRHATACNTAGCTASHPQFVKGQAGSPYAVTDFYDVNPYLAENPERRMEEFGDLVRRTHEAGMKVIIDFVPNHVSRDNVNLGKDDDKTVHWALDNDFFYYPGEKLSLPVDFKPAGEFDSPYHEMPARATGNDCFRPDPGINDWYETVKINYCDTHNRTWDKMLDMLLFWADRGVDGFRCDMVEMVPPAFFKWAIAAVKAAHPGLIFVAEVYDPKRYAFYINEIGFDFLYDKSGIYDAIFDIMVHGAPAHRITDCWKRDAAVSDHLLNFVENHDEVRLASREFARNPLRGFAALGLSALVNRGAFMLYSGGEVGEDAPESEGFRGDDGRTTIFDWWKDSSSAALWAYIHNTGKLDPVQSAVLSKYEQTLRLARKPQFSEGAFYDLNYCNIGSKGFNPDRHFAFLRYNSQICSLVVCNFTDTDADIELHVLPKECNVAVHVGANDYTVIDL